MFRVTIRELLLLTAFFAAGLAALKYANDMVELVIWNGIVLSLLIATVVAVADRGRRQPVASGFASCLAIYLALLLCTNSNAREKWVTDMLVVRLYQVVVTRTWYDSQTGANLAYDSRWEVIGYPPYIKGTRSPKEGYFKAVGHFLWALLFGYLGSRFAACIYDQRHNNRSTPPNNDRPGPGLVPADR